MPADPTPPASPDEAARAPFEAWVRPMPNLGPEPLFTAFQAGAAWQAGRAHDTAAVVEGRPPASRVVGAETASRDTQAASPEVLSNPAAVHLNMLRGSIARPSPANIAHLYRGDEAVDLLSELLRQHPHLEAAGPQEGAQAGWRFDMENAPQDRMLQLWAAPYRDSVSEPLDGFVTAGRWHPDAGFCVCELREVRAWLPLAAAPAPQEGGHD